MVQTASKLPVKKVEKATSAAMPVSETLRPLTNLRRQIDRLFEDFDRSLFHLPFGRSVFDVEPFWRREFSWGGVPAVDIVEQDKAFVITAEVPGLDEKNIEIKLSNGCLILTGEKRDEREEKRKDYYLSERHYGSFERSFAIPEGVDPDKIEASYTKGVLTLTLPKRPEARKPEKVIPIKS
ncbi:MAG: Hsp20/alpha crystallin family protein [Pseudomonas sp.]